MFHFSDILATVGAGLQDFLATGILHWLTSLLGGIFPS